jgi:hypothetical protein
MQWVQLGFENFQYSSPFRKSGSAAGDEIKNVWFWPNSNLTGLAE